jgi:hypothetical protein
MGSLAGRIDRSELTASVALSRVVAVSSLSQPKIALGVLPSGNHVIYGVGFRGTATALSRPA